MQTISLIVYPSGDINAITNGIIVFESIHANLCSLTLATEGTFKLSYVGVSSTVDAWISITDGTNTILNEKIIPEGNHRQMYFPYGFVTVEATGQTLYLQIVSQDLAGYGTGEFAGTYEEISS